MDTSQFTTEAMTPLVGTTWRVVARDGQTFELTLLDVQKTLDKHIDPRLTRDSFSMSFRGPREPYLPQAMYDFHHDEIGGPHQIFIVPTSRDQAGYRYEAVFT